MVLSGAERTANFRYAGQLQKAIDRLHNLLENAPAKYADDFRRLPQEKGSYDLSETLFECVSIITKSPWQIIETDGNPSILFENIYGENLTEELEIDHELYQQYLQTLTQPKEEADKRLRYNSELDQMKQKWQQLGIQRQFSSIHHFSSDTFQTQPYGLTGFYNYCRNKDLNSQNQQTLNRALKTASLAEGGDSIELAIDRAWKEYPLILKA